MRIATWNVNGIRAAMDKGLRRYAEDERPDVLCLQEVRARPDQVDADWIRSLGYHAVFNPADKPGYSGVAIWSLTPPDRVTRGMRMPEHDSEGRVIRATIDGVELVTVYTPNAQNELRRLPYRQTWDTAFLDYVNRLNRRKPVVFCGDLNVAHREIDLANPGPNRGTAGFTDEERGAIDRMIDSRFVDAFRHFDDAPGRYTWWTYRGGARVRNVGWRLDYFMVAKRLMKRVGGVTIRDDVHGSDHCPVEMEIDR